MKIRNIAMLLVFVSIVSCTSHTKNDPGYQKVSLDHPGFQPLGSGDVVTQGFLDNQGDMWFSTTRDGVYKYDGTTFTHFTEDDGLCSKTVNAIVQDKEGKMWFGTGNGLCVYDGKEFKHVPLPKDGSKSKWLDDTYPIVNPAGVLSLLIDSEGVLWAGSNGAGVYSYDGKRFSSYLKKKGTKMPDGLHHNVIGSIVEDTEGNIWFTSFSHGGVTKYDGEQFRDYGVEAGLGDDMIAKAYLDKAGQLWFCSRAGGVSKYVDGKFVTYLAIDGACMNNMAVMLEDQQGHFWVGSFARSGICLYENGGFVPVEKEGFDNLVDVKSITEDKEGNVWFGGRYGLLWRYDGLSLQEFTNKGK